MEQDIQKSLQESDKIILSWRHRIFNGLNQGFLWIMKGYLVLSVVELIFFPSFEVTNGKVKALSPLDPPAHFFTFSVNDAQVAVAVLDEKKY